MPFVKLRDLIFWFNLSFFFFCVCILSFHFFLCVVLMWFINAGSVTINLALLSAIVFACVSLYQYTPKLITSNQKLRKRNGVRVTVNGASVERTRRRTVEAICNFFFFLRLPLSGSNNCSNNLLFFFFVMVVDWVLHILPQNKSVNAFPSPFFLSLSLLNFTHRFFYQPFLFLAFSFLSLISQCCLKVKLTQPSLYVCFEKGPSLEEKLSFFLLVPFFLFFFYTLKSLWHVIAQRR